MLACFICLLGNLSVLFSREVQSVMANVSDHVAKEVQQFLKDHGYAELDGNSMTLLKGQIESIASPSQPVHRCLRKCVIIVLN